MANIAFRLNINQWVFNVSNHEQEEEIVEILDCVADDSPFGFNEPEESDD